MGALTVKGASRLAQELGTFGFRGEALSSLCALAEVAVVTRTADMAAAVRLAYDQAGAVLSQASAARAVGTTVAVKELFKPLPVRFKVGAASNRMQNNNTTCRVIPLGLISAADPGMECPSPRTDSGTLVCSWRGFRARLLRGGFGALL